MQVHVKPAKSRLEEWLGAICEGFYFFRSIDLIKHQGHD